MKYISFHSISVIYSFAANFFREDRGEAINVYTEIDFLNENDMIGKIS